MKIEPGSPAAVIFGRWGLASAMVIAAVLLGHLIRDVPHLLPNRLPGLLCYELGPGLILALAIGIATNLTRAQFHCLTRILLFVLLAAIAGAVVLAMAFEPSLSGRWI